MKDDLICRAEALRARFKVLEGVKGSGFHDEDRNQARNEKFLAPQKNGLPPASEQPVAFVDYEDDRVIFVGQDAERVMDILKNWQKHNSDMDLTVATGTQRKLMIKIIPKLEVCDGVLELKLNCWNDVLEVLDGCKCGLQCLTLVDDGSPLPGQ